MAAAAQQAVKAQKTPVRQNKEQTPPEKKSVREKLYDLPRAAGIAIMCVLLVVSLFVGNFRALQNATPRDFYRQGDVASIMEDRTSAAGNAVTVARRAGLDESLYLAVESAAQEFSAARSARDISRADQTLTTAMSNMIFAATDSLSEEDQRLLSRASDDFNEQGSFLRQEARSYNEDAQDAQDLYDMLPTRFVLPQPDRYEGI